METSSAVTVVGAGPVGLYTALILGQAGIETHVFEREKAVLDSPRAAAWFPVTLDEFKKTGICDDVVKAGFKNTKGVAWRKPKDGGVLAYLDTSGDPDKFAMQLGQHEVCKIMLRHLERYPCVKVHFDTTFVGLEERSDGQVEAKFVHGADQIEQKYLSQYVVAADGGKSSVRSFLGIRLEGWTWDDFQIIAANIEYDLDGQSDWGSASYIVDPNIWAVVAKLADGPYWRVATGQRIGDSDDKDNQVSTWDQEKGMEWIKKRLAVLLPGDTEKAKIVKLSPYTMHQRCIPNFRHGRVVFAGDAAHLTNPTGGLGLTTGLMDAALLARYLRQIISHKEPADALLDDYAEKRWKVFNEYTSPTAVANRLRLTGTSPEINKEREDYLRGIREMDMGFLMDMMESDMRVCSTLNMQ